MGPYNPQDLFSDALVLDLIDLVKGGTDGDANGPLKALADRTQYLFNRQGQIQAKVLTASYTYDPADANKLFAFDVSNNTTFTLPNVTTVPVGTVIRINAKINAIKALTSACFGTQKIKDGSVDLAAMYLHDGERLWLNAVSSSAGAFGDHWQILLADGNFNCVGESVAVRKQPRNSFVLDGRQPIPRADTPRLTNFALSLTDGREIVSDAIWLSDPGGKPVYRGLFSYGNGSTTLRLPDERGLSDKYLDLGRGLDAARLHNFAGGLEWESVLKHNHKQLTPIEDPETWQNGSEENKYGPGWKLRYMDFRNNDYTDFNEGGGSANRVKTLGKIPVIKY